MRGCLAAPGRLERRAAPRRAAPRRAAPRRAAPRRAVPRRAGPPLAECSPTPLDRTRSLRTVLQHNTLPALLATLFPPPRLVALPGPLARSFSLAVARSLAPSPRAQASAVPTSRGAEPFSGSLGVAQQPRPAGGGQGGARRATSRRTRRDRTELCCVGLLLAPCGYLQFILCWAPRGRALHRARYSNRERERVREQHEHGRGARGSGGAPQRSTAARKPSFRKAFCELSSSQSRTRRSAWGVPRARAARRRAAASSSQSAHGA